MDHSGGITGAPTGTPANPHATREQGNIICAITLPRDDRLDLWEYGDHRAQDSNSQRG